MQKLEQIYEGKAKKVYATDDPNLVIVDYKDDATALDGLKKGTSVGKGGINNQMTNRRMARMEKAGIPTHVVQELEGDEGQQQLEEYADASTERGKCLLHSICEKLGFDSLGYQSIDGLLEAIGIDKDKICTYCWTGKE